jgi:hypothetical protein
MPGSPAPAAAAGRGRARLQARISVRLAAGKNRIHGETILRLGRLLAMRVPARPTRNHQHGSRRSLRAVVTGAARPARSVEPAPEPIFRVRRRSRERGPLQDHAVYSCECGYVFVAVVSTSVSCPHCGGHQAW